MAKPSSLRTVINQRGLMNASTSVWRSVPVATSTPTAWHDRNLCVE